MTNSTREKLTQFTEMDDSDSNLDLSITDLGSGGFDSASRTTIARRETRRLLGIKILFVLVLFLSAAGALGVHFYIRSRENAEFENQFRDDASKVFAAIGATLDFSLQASDAFVASLISTAEATGQTWPFVTMPDWASRAGKVRSLTGALYMNIYTYVEDNQREAWENYTAHNNQWVMETVEAQRNDPKYKGNTTVSADYENWDVIYGYDEFDKDNGGQFGTNQSGPYLVYWQCTPVLAWDPVYNWDLLTDWYLTNCSEWELEEEEPESDDAAPCNEYETPTDIVVKKHQVVITEAYGILAQDATPEEIFNAESEADWVSHFLPPDEEPMEPQSDIYYPILPSARGTYNQDYEAGFDPLNQTFAGVLSLTFFWRDTIRDTLPTGSNGIVVVFNNPCNPTFTYQINGPTVEFLGSGDHHDDSYNHLEQSATLFELQDYTIKGSSYTGIPIDETYCNWSLHIYPSDTMKEGYTSVNATIFTTTAAVVFLLTSLVFVIYDICVERRQKVVLQTAVSQRAIVTSLFPPTFVDRISESFGFTAAGDQSSSQRQQQQHRGSMGGESGSGVEAAPTKDINRPPPLADTFADCTVALIDIVGFTCWSSVRHPSQVFTLLESLYGAYDAISQKRKVFKVETIGDSYVCVTGLPHPQTNHATIMVRFCAEARTKMNSLVKTLELELGPGTANLSMRVGLHSGPVTAGVLRGQKARFQLFGDTVNTAARMESTGVPNKIHVSRKTAQQLGREGKGHWVEEREELVSCKGKGNMATFFAEPQKLDDSKRGFGIPSSSFKASKNKPDSDPELELRQRLIDWNVVLLHGFLKEVVAHRRTLKKTAKSPRNSQTSLLDLDFLIPDEATKMIRDEVLDTIPLPTYEDQQKRKANLFLRDRSAPVDLGPAVMEQLRLFVTAIAARYPSNAFHSFEHASHVCMSAKKLLHRVCTSGSEEDALMDSFRKEEAHYQTYGIRSDPLTQFAIVFSALVHDVEHPGVANGQLVKEGTEAAKKYQGKSVAEQHSVAITWQLLMEDRFKDLQACIFPDIEEFKRFRQIVVNAVVTTDIFDKELKAARENRWERTYGSEANTEKEREKDLVDRKATIVIELVIQASDVSHTMQHWHVYQSWNHKLLKEQYTAYKAGRLEKNPIDGWYGGELWFFDNYIIPLASKMRDCEVFGVSCDEFLDFATENRLEWANKGKDIVADWAETLDEECEEELKRAKLAKESLLKRSVHDRLRLSCLDDRIMKQERDPSESDVDTEDLSATTDISC